ncbi:unnamed protein product (macronuclear) [Paramecium tetraurelia]|uniref:Cilia- and flagella-associated protein 157 n=1 Tax=Paramecium tetraurelia TaxID=5888 RepID=A0C0D7_PARTE|nr:uncharacterized protein GSPATT00006107001 [Paramecium tetraurelia]CAK64254.1 unnamed protein product [Paramecium tetraurelia]|eukprot:XP_001431652.1 hypothetical protein (macronuclear) [Paramecium tetraurelia strain d4-2]
MKQANNSNQLQQLDPIEVIDNLETLKKVIKQKDVQIKNMETEFQERLNAFQLAVARDQDGLKQDIIQFLLKDNEQQKKIEQLHINYELLQNQLEETFLESNNKIKTLLDINDKKDHEIEQLKQQIKDTEERVNQLRKNSISKDRNMYETEAVINKKVLDLQKREADLTFKLKQALEKNEQLSNYFENYQSEKEVKLIKQVEHLKKQNSSQINNISSNYEDQVKTSKEVIEQLQDHILNQKDRFSQIQDENQKLKCETEIANNYYQLLIGFKIQSHYMIKQEKNYNKQKTVRKYQREIINCKQTKFIFREIQALQIQLGEATKYIDLTTNLQQRLNQKDQKISHLLQENQQLQELVQDLRLQVSSVEQHFQQHADEQRKANILLSNKEFELQTIIESQAQNFAEQEQKLKQGFEELWLDYSNLQYNYELLKQKSGEDSFRLKLYKTNDKKASRAIHGSQTRMTIGEKDHQNNQETIKINDDAFLKTLESFQKQDQAKQTNKRLDRNVYVRRG